MRDSEEKIFVKYLRAKYKTLYHKEKKDKCFVCGSSEKLELHHNKPLVEIAKEYLKNHGIINPTNDSVLRDAIFEEYREEICGEENLVTLCSVHHKGLHNLFGKSYNIKQADKVKKYLQRQQEKYNGK